MKELQKIKTRRFTGISFDPRDDKDATWVEVDGVIGKSGIFAYYYDQDFNTYYGIHLITGRSYHGARTKRGAAKALAIVERAFKDGVFTKDIHSKIKRKAQNAFPPELIVELREVEG